MIPNAYPPGTPDWWMSRLVYKLLDQQPRYDVLEDYHIGRHPLPKVDPKKLTAIKRFMEMAQTNYITLVNNAPVGRMRLKDFRFGAEGDPDPDAKQIWSANDMNLQSKKLHTACSVMGDCYVLVGPIDEYTGFPTMTVKDPRLAIVEAHPNYPTRAMAGLEMWQDPYLKKVVAVLYLPDVTRTYIGGWVNDIVGSKKDITNRLLNSPYGFDLVSQVPNEVGEVPLVHFEWQPDFSEFSLGEAELVLHIQDRINQMIFDRLVTANAQAFQKLYATGVKQAKQAGTNPKKGPTAPPWELGADNLWVTDDPDTKIGALPPVDFKQMLEAVRDDIADIAAITQTPAHYLMNRMVNVSGETLEVAESGFISKTELRMEAMGWGWMRAMRIAMKFMGKTAKAIEPEVSVIWVDPMVRKEAEAADAASKWSAAGVTDVGVLMEAFGSHNFDAEQISFMRKEQQRLAAEAKVMQDKQMQVGLANKKNAPGGTSG